VRAVEYDLVDIVTLALEKNAEIRVQNARVDAAAGQLQQADGKFDPMVFAGALQSRTVTALLPPGPAGQREQRDYLVQYQAGVQKLLRNGNMIETTLTADSRRDNVLEAAPDPARNYMLLSTAVTVPLLKGRGAHVTSAEVESASQRLQASRHERRFRTSQVMQATLGAYWDYVARARLETLAQATARRSKDLLDSTEKLVQANERPRGDLVLLRADYVDKRAAAMLAAQALVDARRALARYLGIDGNAAALLTLREEAFPPESPAIARLLGLAPALSALVLQRRDDILGAQLQLEQASLQQSVARDNLKPQLDLRVGFAYGKASEGGSRYGFPAQPGPTVGKPSAFAQLNYQFPLGNRTATGQLVERAALQDEMAIVLRDTQTAATNGVLAAVQQLATSAAQLASGKESLALYEQAVNQEISKQQNGIATLIDVITIESRYNQAQANLIQLHAQYAKALVNLQHETGTMFRSAGGAGKDEFALHVPDLFSLAPVFDLLQVSL
jgi:outer membrane protein TolC